VNRPNWFVALPMPAAAAPAWLAVAATAPVPLRRFLPHRGTEAHVLDVARAPGIAVRQQQLAPADHGDRRIGEQLGAGGAQETAAQQQVAVAVHDVHAHAPLAERTQGGGDPRRNGVAFVVERVVADPVLE